MGMYRFAALRTSDFQAAIWFKPADQGGLSRITYWTWQHKALARFEASPPVPVRLAFLDNWITPGDSKRCGMAIDSWHDADRARVDVGTPFDLDLEVSSNGSSTLQCIGLGRILELEDPYGRYFFADAIVRVVLQDGEIELLKGVPLDLWLPRLDMGWAGHLDVSKQQLGSTAADAGEFLLCFHDLWRDHGRYPDQGHPIRIGDEFEMRSETRKIGNATIISWTSVDRSGGPRVCYPRGWRKGSGVSWRKDWSG